MKTHIVRVKSGIKKQAHFGKWKKILFNYMIILNGVGSIYTPDSLGNATFRVTGQDGAMWDGYYGPIVSGGEMWFTYRSNPCAQTAMYDPSCDGYAEAYATYEYDNNCSASATYDQGCPGYWAAHYDQQCSMNALYDSGCPGYAAAYYDQQCGIDALYDSGCPGYAEAYYDQQCGIDALYDSGCPGYETAYIIINSAAISRFV